MTHTGLRTVLKIFASMRPRQWVKNTLVFLPLVLSHQFLDKASSLRTTIAFLAFCLCASAIYVLNDYVDSNADKLHPVKKKRPFASGDLPLHWAPPLSLFLAMSSLGLAYIFSSTNFLLVLSSYAILSISYSLLFKRKPILDVIVLAGLYTLRIIAGGASTGVEISEWLLTFSGFIFISLAFAKRYAEMARLSKEGDSSAAGRGYLVVDLQSILALGSTSGFIAVLVLALYIHSEFSRNQYPFSEALWIICPVLTYWIGRLWLIAGRNQLFEDPVLFAIQDRASLLVLAIIFCIFLFASYVEF